MEKKGEGQETLNRRRYIEKCEVRDKRTRVLSLDEFSFEIKKR